MKSSKVKAKYIQEMERIRPATTPGVLLINPRDPHNVGNALRACSCWGMNQLWFTGDRVIDKLDGLTRLPREERMKGYREVEVIHNDQYWKQFEKVDVTPVAIEVRQNSENLVHFEHPENALYIFGPEDGSLPVSVLNWAHRFVMMPTAHCLNLAAAVNVVLYDRRLKAIQSGKDDRHGSQDFLSEHRGML